MPETFNPNELAPTENSMKLPATQGVNTGMLLASIMDLMKSNMTGDGRYTNAQINNQTKLTSVAIRTVELELKLNKARTI